MKIRSTTLFAQVSLRNMHVCIQREVLLYIELYDGLGWMASQRSSRPSPLPLAELPPTPAAQGPTWP